MILIRPETRRDFDAIAEINRLAFGQDDEAKLVEGIRLLEGFDPDLSLVAASGDALIGHILFSPIHIECEMRTVSALALAPMAVRPEHQRKGIGTRLVEEGLNVCKGRGHRLVIVLGHPDYYPRFGFVPGSRHGLRCPFPAPDEAFMGLALFPGALHDVAGLVVYSKPFSQV